MIKSLTITNHLGDSIVLDLMRPEKSGFIVKNIEGLGPVRANINMSASATSDGSTFNSAFMNTRDINLSLLYYQTETETIEDIRQKSYKYFPNKKKIRLLIETDNRTVWTEGYVEDNAPDIFSQESGCVITIRCPDPYLYSVNGMRTLFNGVISTFEFPFGNESNDTPLLEFGTIVDNAMSNVRYEGDCEVGCTIVIDAIGSINDLAIYRGYKQEEEMSIDVNKLETGIQAGDTIVIETSIGKKGITLTRNGMTYNILNCMNRGSIWFTLAKGDNWFSYTVDEPNNVRFHIVNKIVYYGV